MAMSRKVLSVMLLCALALGMSCSGLASAGKPVTIRFISLAWQTQAIEAVKAIVAEWNAANPSIQVQYVQMDWGSIHDYMITSFEAKDVPDIFHYESIPIIDFGKRGYLTDLATLISDDLRTDVMPGAWETVTGSNGAIYGIPFLWESLIVLYNKDLFAEAGVKPPTIDNPWTWEEMRQAARLLTKDRDGDRQVDQFGVAFGLKSPVNRVFNLSMGFGGQYFYDQNGKPVIRVGDAEKELLRILLDMMYVEKTASLDGVGLSGPELFPGFFAGKYAMLPGIGVWARQQIVERAPAGFKWGVLPPLKAKTQAQGSTTQTLSIPSAAKHKKEAMQFLEFLASRENMAKLALGDWLFPTRASSLDLPAFRKEEGGWNIATESARHLTLAPWQKVMGFQEFKSKVATPLFQQLFANRISLDEFARRMETEGNRVLQRYQ